MIPPSIIMTRPESIHGELTRIRVAVEQSNHWLERIVALLGPDVVGLNVSPGPPTDRHPLTTTTTSEGAMAAKPKITCVKKSAAKKAAPGAKAAGPMRDFLLMDNEDSTFTVFGVDAGGNQVDIAPVATLTPAPTSSDATILTVDPPSGMTAKVHALKPGTATLTFGATWNDGSVGPFTVDWPQSVQGTAATGLTVVPGTPVVRP